MDDVTGGSTLSSIYGRYASPQRTTSPMPPPFPQETRLPRQGDLQPDKAAETSLTAFKVTTPVFVPKRRQQQHLHHPDTTLMMKRYARLLPTCSTPLFRTPVAAMPAGAGQRGQRGAERPGLDLGEANAARARGMIPSSPDRPPPSPSPSPSSSSSFSSSSSPPSSSLSSFGSGYGSTSALLYPFSPMDDSNRPYLRPPVAILPPSPRPVIGVGSNLVKQAGLRRHLRSPAMVLDRAVYPSLAFASTDPPWSAIRGAVEGKGKEDGDEGLRRYGPGGLSPSSASQRLGGSDGAATSASIVSLWPPYQPQAVEMEASVASDGPPLKYWTTWEKVGLCVAAFILVAGVVTLSVLLGVQRAKTALSSL